MGVPVALLLGVGDVVVTVGFGAVGIGDGPRVGTALAVGVVGRRQPAHGFHPLFASSRVFALIDLRWVDCQPESLPLVDLGQSVWLPAGNGVFGVGGGRAVAATDKGS